MKKHLWLRTLLCGMIVGALMLTAACADSAEAENSGDSEAQVTVIATLFPPYDFVRAVGGERVQIEKLMAPGIESHSFEPTPTQIIDIGNCDLFLYAGDLMEPWVAEVAASVEGSADSFIDATAGIELLPVAEDHDHEGEAEEAHEFAYDPHVWTDPTLAMQMVDNIAAALTAVDPAGADYYATNAAKYKQQLQALDVEFRQIVNAGNRTELVFGSSFAFLYFCERYGLTHLAAFDSCAGHAEPSARRVADLIDEIKAEQIPVVFYAELSEPTVANSIAAETGAEPLLLHSCHNVSKDDMAAGVTYIDLMKQNAENLKKGLQ